MLQAALITNDAVFEQTTEILGDLYVSIRVLELNKLDDFIQNILHHEVIAILGNLAVFEQCQVEEVMHFELDDACL